MSRLPLLLATINSVACQKDVQLECIVIEQDSIPRVKEFLPSWVKHIFLHTSDLSGKYNRSAAFNLGASHASGSILVLHDNDMLMPTQYCKSIEDIVDNGYDALNTKRYVFYLSSSHSLKVLADFQELTKYPPEYIVQNLEAGGSMAITKEAYTMIGGMDEEFVGWGGEDIDLWERCSILNRWIWGFQPLIHLWHPSQPLKNRKNNPNIHRLHQLRNQEIAERITFLKNRRQF
jgi:GT2 family glycosyltransferase